MLRARHFVYLALLLALAFCRAHGQDIYACYNGSSEQGGNRITTNGIQSGQYVQQSYPGATTTVYLHSTTTLATIFSDAAGLVPLANPFTSSSHSVAFWCASDNRYDVKYSGTTITSPFTVSDIQLCFSCSGGGGGGSVGPGTVNQIAKFTSTTNVGNSSGFDDGVGLTQWPFGLTSMGSAYGKLYPNSTNGTTANKLACIDATVTSIAEVTTCTASTTKAIGIVHAGTAGVTGNAQIAMFGFDSCVFDNQTVVGDYAGPSTSVAGDCTDLGGTRPASFQGVGRVTTLNSGTGTSAVVDLGPWDLFAPGSSGAGQCSFNNTNAYFTGGNVACDQFVTDDGSGNMTMKSLGLTDVTQAGFFYLKQGTLPSATPANTRMDTMPTSVTTHTVKHPGTAGAVGQTEVVASTATDTNGNTIDIMSWGTAGGGGVEAQTNGTDNTNCVAGVCPLVNAQTGLGVTVSNPSGGTWNYALTGATQIATPTAPTLATIGSAGSTSITYKIVGCEDPACTYHTAASSSTTIATANATLTSSNAVKLTAYGDTLYGPRCYDVYRTAAGGTPSTTGLVAHCVGKAFIDTGLAGDSSTAPTTNSTVLLPNMASLPGCNVPGFAALIGVDAPPCSPTATDDEMQQTFGAPADVNNPFWTWFNQDTATAAWSSGAMIITSAANASHNLEGVYEPLPGSTPYTYVSYFDAADTGGGTEANCGIGFLESATGKLTTFGMTNDAAINSVSAGGGMLMIVFNFPSATNYAGNTIPKYNAYRGANSGYFKIQNTGTNIVYSFSPSGDGINFTQFYSQTVGTPFTTAPNRLVIFATGNSGSQTSCTFDFVRRTQ